jgi:hypothetical protein
LWEQRSGNCGRKKKARAFLYPATSGAGSEKIPRTGLLPLDAGRMVMGPSRLIRSSEKEKTKTEIWNTKFHPRFCPYHQDLL